MAIHRYRDLELCAEDGIINVINRKTGNIKQVVVSEWVERLNSLRKAAEYLPHSESAGVKDYDRSLLAAIPQMEAVLYDAIAQGNPENPRVMADMIANAKNKYTVVN